MNVKSDKLNMLHFKKILKFNFTLFLFISFVFAEDCQLRTKHGRTSFIYLNNDPTASSDQRLKLDSSFKSIIPLLNYFVLPEEVKVDVYMDHIRQNGYADKNLIIFGIKEYNFSNHVDPILTHEFGHLIFGNKENLKKIFSPEELIRVETTMRLFPYDEFFADLFAVLATKDGASMYSAVQNKVKDRDFTSNGMDTSIEEIKKNKFYFKDYHNYFFKARQLLWKRYEEEGKTEKSAQMILQKTYLAIGNSVKNRLKKYPNKNRTKALTPEELNFVEQDLLEEIQKILQ